MTDKDLCILCGHQCCKWIAFTYGELSGQALEFYLARGCKILRCDPYIDGEKKGTSLYRIYIPHPCPHLIEGKGCAIYDRRPLVCLEYSGSDDPLVKELCRIGKSAPIITNSNQS